jgi:multisubunit Na+/H+ antiporter MnhE subunit
MESPNRFREIFTDSIRYWEPRRIIYNGVLTIVTSAWLIVTWPHFRGSFTLQFLFLLVILASVANVCYCAAYFADICVQFSTFRADWRRWRWALWCSGTLFAILLANYWIADEIYPYVR